SPARRLPPPPRRGRRAHSGARDLSSAIPGGAHKSDLRQARHPPKRRRLARRDPPCHPRKGARSEDGHHRPLLLRLARRPPPRLLSCSGCLSGRALQYARSAPRKVRTHRKRHRPPLLVGRDALLHAHRRSRGDLGPDRRGGRLVGARTQGRRDPPHGGGTAGRRLTLARDNGWCSRMATITSYEPATGETLWTGETGDVDAEVSRARGAWAGWASKPLAVRIETLRRFANVVRGKKDQFADLIARETGKPLWETATEVDAVVNKVDISVSAYSERTSQRRMEGAMGARVAVRHKPHGVLAVLGPYNFPAHLPNGHIVPALIAGNAVVFKPSEKTPAVGEFLVNCFHEAVLPEGVVGCVQGGPD